LDPIGRGVPVAHEGAAHPLAINRFVEDAGENAERDQLVMIQVIVYAATRLLLLLRPRVHQVREARTLFQIGESLDDLPVVFTGLDFFDEVQGCALSCNPTRIEHRQKGDHCRNGHENGSEVDSPIGWVDDAYDRRCPLRQPRGGRAVQGLVANAFKRHDNSLSGAALSGVS
jgi:hypothetical protein